MRRFLCLYFPRWPIQYLRHVHPETRGKPAAIFRRAAHGRFIVLCSKEANGLGVRRGMPLADATALVPDLLLFEADFTAYQQALEKLCLWVGRFSPLAGVEAPCAAIEHPQSILLDITGCDQVFKGEDQLLEQALRSLQRRGFQVRAAIGWTIGAAWALAHFGGIAEAPRSQSKIQNLKSKIDFIPLAGLRIESQVIVYLNKLGLHRIGEVLDQPRASLPSRFGTELIKRIDQLLGDEPEMVPLLRPPPEIRVARAFEYPIKNCELLLNIAEQMMGNLTKELHAQNKGARQIECWLYREADDPLCIEVTLYKASANKKHLMQLLRTKAEALPRLIAHNSRKIPNRDSHFEAEEGICAVALHVVSSETLNAGQMDLFEKESQTKSEHTAGICGVVDRIVSRLGAESALQAIPVADAQPECGVRSESFMKRGTESQNKSCPSQTATQIARPLRLLPEALPLLSGELRADGFPANFEGHGRSIAVEWSRGPERIETGWWRASYVRRDYYIVDAQNGSRYWIFRRLDDGRWFLHGVFE